VSAAAKDKTGSEPHGRTVSAVARSDCGKAEGSTSSAIGDSSTTSTSVTDGERGANPNRGRGNAKGGNGNRGNGGGSSGKN
jgi:hypothetical protein